MDSTIKVLALTSIFPNSAQPGHGVFMLHRLWHLAQSGAVEMQVVAPVPWFPFRHTIFGRYADYASAAATSRPRGLAVCHPRFLSLPKLGMQVAALLMALSLLPRLLAIRRAGFDFDVIDAYYLYPDGVAASLLGLWLRRPVVTTALGTDVNLIPDDRIARSQILWSARRAAASTAVCQALKDRLVALGAQAPKIAVVEHGVDAMVFQPPPDRRLARQALGLHRPTLISVGQLVARKGHHLVIEAMTGLPNAELLIAGSGADEHKLKSQVSRLGLTDRVRFLGQLSQTQLSACVGAADALVLCSSREGIANVLLEALSCGTPVVATAIWGTPEVIDSPDAGVLVHRRSADGIRDAIAALLRDPPHRDATRRHASRYRWQATAALHEQVLRRATGLQRRAPVPR